MINLIKLSNVKLPNLSMRSSALVFALAVCAALAAVLAKPRLIEVDTAVVLEQAIPRQFGDWKERPNPYAQVRLTTGNETSINQPYDQTVMRTYVNSQGKVVMLAIAWGRKQRQEVKVHRPDLCYVAQGYRVKGLTPVTFSSAIYSTSPVIGKRMLALSEHGGEAVSYWIRIGSLYSEDAVDTRLHIFKEGLGGRIPDGVLVRASQPVDGPEAATKAWPVLESFLQDLVASTPPEGRHLLVR